MKLTDRQKNVLIYLKCLLFAILTVIGVTSAIYGLYVLVDKYPVDTVSVLTILLIIWTVLLITKDFYRNSKKNLN